MERELIDQLGVSRPSLREAMRREWANGLPVLAAEGAAVVVNYSSSKEGADRVVGEINGNGGKAVAVQANLAREPDVRRLFAEARKAFGRLDILVNNAGIIRRGTIETVTEAMFESAAPSLALKVKVSVPLALRLGV